jgi:hypothetical protein
LPDDHVADARVGVFLEPPGPRALGDIGRVERGFGIPVLQVLADHGRVGERHAVVDQHGNAAQRRQLGEPIAAHERHDRIDLVVDALEAETSQHLAHVGRHIAADDLYGTAHERAPAM